MTHSAQMNDGVFEQHRLELRCGCLTMAALGQLRTEQYGYALRQKLAGLGLAIDEGTLYPLLRRLESQGLLVSEWREEDKRRKRFPSRRRHPFPTPSIGISGSAAPRPGRLPRVMTPTRRLFRSAMRAVDAAVAARQARAPHLLALLALLARRALLVR